MPDVTDSPNLALLLLGFVFAGYGSSFMFFYAAVRERALAPVAVTAVTALLAAAPPWFVTAGLFRRFALASDAWFWVYSAAFGFSVVFVSPLAHRHAAGARAAWFAATVVAGLAIAVVSIFAIMIARSA